jgi:hypothetical protein
MHDEWYNAFLQYHRSCYESYTSKINLEKIEPVEAQMNASACGSVRTSESICVKTRSMTAPFDWSQHFPFSLALDRVSSQEIWQIMHNSQLLTVRLFFDSEWANVTELHISKNESDIVWLAISDKLHKQNKFRKNWTSWSTNECLCLWLGENIRIYLCKDPIND